MKLSFKLLGILFISTSILFFVLIFLHIGSQKKDLTEAFVERAKATSFIFTSSITDVRDLDNPEFLTQSINHAMWGDPEILAIHLYGVGEDKEPRLLASSDSLRIAIEPDAATIAASAEGETQSQLKMGEDHEIISIYQPLYISGRIHGTVQIDSTLERVEEKITKSVYELVIQYFVLISIFLSFLYVCLRILIFKPLTRFDEAITAVKHSNLNHVIRIASSDEFGKLSVLFNEMLQNLKTANTALLEHTKKIEAEVADRTLEVKKEKSLLEETVSRRTAELQALKDNLESTVALRTKELGATVARLERMNGFMVDRELAIVELKKKLTQCANMKDEADEPKT